MYESAETGNLAGGPNENLGTGMATLGDVMGVAPGYGPAVPKSRAGISTAMERDQLVYPSAAGMQNQCAKPF